MSETFKAIVINQEGENFSREIKDCWNHIDTPTKF